MGLHSRTLLRAGFNRIRVVVGLEPLKEDEFSVRHELKQAGQIVVIFAVMLTVLIGLVGIAIDTTYAWREALRVQRAADSAALAGVVYMPGDFTNASSKAVASATRNQFTAGARTSVAVSRSSDPRELDVSVTTHVPTFFTRIFGVNEFAITRSAKAVYVLPVPMGSPEAYYGTFGKYKVNNVDQNYTGPGGVAVNARGFWGSMLTTGADMINGDAYLPRFNTSGGGTNPQHDTLSYYDYGVSVPAGVSSTVSIFDPGFCDTDQKQGTGETWFGGTTGVSSYYRIYNTNNQPYNLAGHTLVWDSGNFFANMKASDTTEGGQSASGGVLECKAGSTSSTSDPRFYHNKWYTAGVTLTGGTSGTVYRIRTTTEPSDSANASNNFSLYATGAGVQVYGIGAMQMYTPLPAGANATFYLAQIDAASGAGKTIEISLWDPGDTNGLTATLTILMPTTTGWSAVSGMTWTAQRVATGGTSCVGGSGGSIQTYTTASKFNGCWLTIDIVIPITYTAPQSGWWKINYAMGSGSATASDETTWQVSIRGNPVHLIA